jgi:hypothetical protein
MRLSGKLARCLIAVVLSGVLQPVHAIDPPLAERGFHRQRAKMNRLTYANPWIDIDAIEVAPENKDALELRDWLRYYRTYLETWPPRYGDDAEATQLIEAWETMRPRVEQWQPALQASPELAALAVTFWAYGHNLDEPDAAKRGFELIDALDAKFRSHPLPLMLRGMLKINTGGSDSERILRQARAKAKDKRVRGLIDMALAQQCSISFKPHRSLYALSEAVEACPDCVRRYKELAFTIAESSGIDPHIGVENPYFLNKEEALQTAGSRFYGFRADLSYEWGFDGYWAYDPQKPLSGFTFNAAPLSDSGLIHGLTFISAIVDGSATEPAVFLKVFGDPEAGIKITPISPLVKNPYLTHWYRLDTLKRVGKGDVITMIAASGIIRPKLWKIGDHRKLAGDEGPCETPDMKAGELNVLRLNARVRAPVEFTVNYSGSRNSYAEAERRMQEIVRTLQFDSYALSEVEEKLLKALQ